jgi:hypothetical protein
MPLRTVIDLCCELWSVFLDTAFIKVDYTSSDLPLFVQTGGSLLLAGLQEACLHTGCGNRILPLPCLPWDFFLVFVYFYSNFFHLWHVTESYALLSKDGRRCLFPWQNQKPITFTQENCTIKTEKLILIWNLRFVAWKKIVHGWQYLLHDIKVGVRISA